MELARYYLYDWGFVCTAIYESEQPSSQVLLLAFAWLVAYSKMFERRREYILERSSRTEQIRLPPFPNDVDLDTDSVRNAASAVVASTIVPDEGSLPLDAQTHQMHSTFGRLQSHLDDLQSYTRYHERLVRRLEVMQNKAEEHKDELIPAYVLNLLAEPTSRLADQVRVLSQSVQLIEEEELFYKWINGLVLSLNSSDGSDTHVESPANTNHAALLTQMRELQTLFQEHAAVFQQLEVGYKEQWRKWTARQKSLSRKQQMETKVERFTHEVQTRELFDPQKLFLRSERSWAAQFSRQQGKPVQKPHPASTEEVERLQSQLANVIGEITREYCGVQLR